MQWIRLYTDVLNDPKVQTLSVEMFRHWVNLLCVAGNNHGLLPVTLHETAFALRVTESETQDLLDTLQQRGLLDKIEERLTPHSWDKRQYKSDTSNERVQRYRERKRNVTVTPPEADAEAEKKTTKKELYRPDGSYSTLGEYMRAHDWTQIPETWIVVGRLVMTQAGKDPSRVPQQTQAFVRFFTTGKGKAYTAQDWSGKYNTWLKGDTERKAA